MDPKARSGFDLVLPFAIGACMAAGSLVAFTVASPDLLTEGGAGDMAGAAGALTMILAGGGGFVASGCATAVARGLGRGVPRVLVLRCALALMAGGVVGASGAVRGELMEWLGWFCLLLAPALIAWFWRTPLARTVSAVAGDIQDRPR